MQKTENICFRQNRDEEQIYRCKNQLNQLNGSLQDLAQILALAGNEVRLKILILLQEEKQLCVCDLSEILSMKIPAVSQHLRKMKDAGLVFTIRDGTLINYHISPALKPILDIILPLIDQAVLVSASW